MNILSILGQSSDLYITTTSYTSDDVATVISNVFIYIFFFSLIFYIFYALCLGRIFRKAGVAPWIAWVPVYNSWKMLEIGGQKGIWAILAFIPVINILSVIFLYIAMYHIGVKLGKSGAFVLLAIFFTPIWLIWLALDHSVWAGTAELATIPESPIVPVEPTIEPTPEVTAAPTEPEISAPVETPVEEAPAPEAPVSEAPTSEESAPQEENQETPPTPPTM